MLDFYHRAGDMWIQVVPPSSPNSWISVGNTAEVFIVSLDNRAFKRDGVTNKNPIGTKWQELERRFLMISVFNGKAWAIDKNMNVYSKKFHITPSPLASHPSTTTKAANPMTVYSTTTRTTSLTKTETTTASATSTTVPIQTIQQWEQFPGSLKQVAMGYEAIWGLNDGNTLFMMRGYNFEKVNGPMNVKQITVGKKTVLAIDSSGQVYGNSALDPTKWYSLSKRKLSWVRAAFHNFPSNFHFRFPSAVLMILLFGEPLRIMIFSNILQKNGKEFQVSSSKSLVVSLEFGESMRTTEFISEEGHKEV